MQSDLSIPRTRAWWFRTEFPVVAASGGGNQPPNLEFRDTAAGEQLCSCISCWSFAFFFLTTLRIKTLLSPLSLGMHKRSLK